jgi:putative tryptophan/tyrosine transport system substrate-binding protein
MKRREFVTLIGGAALLPLSVRAQQPDRIYRIGVLILGANGGELDAQQRAVFTRALTELGWTEGKNIQIDWRWAANDVAQIPGLARELLSLKPDVILVQGTPTVAVLQRETKTTPIIFVSVTDPVLSGAVASLSHPGGNITGFSNFEPTLVGKYVEILKEITPGMTAVVRMFNPDNPVTFITRPLLEAAARYHGVELIFAPARDASDIERVIASLGDKPTAGLSVAGEPVFGMGQNLALIVSLAIRYRVRAVYSFRHFVEAGGLISYGNDLIDQYRQAATYVDRILKGANPADLPVQAPTKFEMVINLKTAKAMGLSIPPALLARADEVIE